MCVRRLEGGKQGKTGRGGEKEEIGMEGYGPVQKEGFEG